MNDKLQYASMLEIPVSTCNITVKESKKKRQKRKKNIAQEDVKDRLIGQINARSQEQEKAIANEGNIAAKAENQSLIGSEDNAFSANETVAATATNDTITGADNVAVGTNNGASNMAVAEQTATVQCYDEARRATQSAYSQTEEEIPLFRIDNAGEFATTETTDDVNGLTYLEGASALEQEVNSAEPTVQEGYEATSTVKHGRVKVKKERIKKSRSINAITVQLLIIGVLIATIFVTNALYTDSGVNVFLRSVFGTESVVVDSREYTDFAPVINDSDISGYTVEAGVISLSGEGRVYASVDGTVSRLEVADDGKITLEITHNKNFVSVFSGLDYAYSGVGDTVYGNIPVGFIRGEAEMCFLGSNGQVISNYTVVDDTVVWSV